jgi:mRNA interferase RelE/StbE
MNLEIIEKKGLKFVQVPLTVYERLCKDAEELADMADIAAADAAKAEFEKSDAVLEPAEVVNRILDENLHPLQAWREYRGLTQAKLAEASGVSRNMIAQMECRNRNGSIATLRKLTKALEVGMENLLEDLDE